MKVSIIVKYIGDINVDINEPTVLNCVSSHFGWNIHYPACCGWRGKWAWAALSSSSMRRGTPALSVTSPQSSDCPGPSRNGAGPGTVHGNSRQLNSLYRQNAFGLSSETSSSFDLRSECIHVISDLVEFRCSQNTDVSVGSPAQAQLLAVSWDRDTKTQGLWYPVLLQRC